MLAFGVLLGIKHAIEPDHIVAVSTLSSRTRNVKLSSLSGLFWGVGHSLTVVLIGLITVIVGKAIPAREAMYLELGVAAMLIFLGVTSIYGSLRNKAFHQGGFGDQSDLARDRNRFFLKSLAVGFVHGMAGSAAILLLTLTAVDTVWGGFMYLMMFAAGSIVGMVLFSTVLGASISFGASKFDIHKPAVIIAGAISILFGIYYALEIAQEIKAV
jgi:hypothetical protein